MSSLEFPFAKPATEAKVCGTSTQSVLYDGRKANLRLDIVIIGCGLGGLAAAHCLGKAGHKVS